MARSTRLVILIKKMYTLWGRKRFLLPVTYFPTNLVYPFTLRVTGINIQLADPRFNAPQRVDLLIGVSLFFEMLCVGQIKLPPGLPLIQKTRLGWVVFRGYGLSKDSALMSSQDVLLASRENSFDRLDDLLRRFREVESCAEPIIRATKEELDCEAHFIRHVVRLPAGDYSVRLPAKFNLYLLGQS